MEALMKARSLLLALLAAAVFVTTTETQSRISPGSMPSVERVVAEIKGTSPMDTAARQVGAFWQLRQIIETLAGPRLWRGQLTPEETRLVGEYNLGYRQAAQPFANLKGTPEGAKFYQMHTFYEVDDDFRFELVERFLAPPLRAEYLRLKGISDARWLEQSEAARRQREYVQSGQAQAEADAKRRQAEQDLQASIAQQQPRPWQRALARCIASGRSESQCFTESAARDSPLANMFLAAPRVAPGLSLSGVYSGAGGFTMTFYPDVVMVACQEVGAAGAYAIERSGGQVRVKLLAPSKLAGTPFASNELLASLLPQNAPANPEAWQEQQINASLRADGTLMASRLSPGPVASISVTGQVPLGTARTATGEMVTVYETRTRTCPLGGLEATGPASPFGSGSTAGAAGMSLAIDLLAGKSDPAVTKMPPPGFRMNGRYADQRDFEVEFHPESAVVTCRDAVAAGDYSVAITGDRGLVTIQNGGGSIVLELRPDGTLAGSGPVQVNGRVIAGQNANGDLVFQPKTDTCTIGTLTPVRSQ
jgi:hypothetical protein